MGQHPRRASPFFLIMASNILSSSSSLKQEREAECPTGGRTKKSQSLLASNSTQVNKGALGSLVVRAGLAQPTLGPSPKEPPGEPLTQPYHLCRSSSRQLTMALRCSMRVTISPISTFSRPRSSSVQSFSARGEKLGV